MRLPAYGRPLLEARRAGDHPARVLFVFGDYWKAESPHPKLALKPGDYAPRRFDFRLVAGVPVDVLERSDGALHQGTPKYLWLAGELARWACEVTLRVPYALYRGQAESDRTVTDAGMLARCQRRYDAAKRAFVWPAWWNEDLDCAYGEQGKRWYGERFALVAGLVGV